MPIDGVDWTNQVVHFGGRLNHAGAGVPSFRVAAADFCHMLTLAHAFGG